MQKTCRETVLKLHPGTVKHFSTRAHQGIYYFIFLTLASDGTEWLNTCNAGTGEIVKSVAVDGL